MIREFWEAGGRAHDQRKTVHLKQPHEHSPNDSLFIHSLSDYTQASERGMK